VDLFIANFYVTHIIGAWHSIFLEIQVEHSRKVNKFFHRNLQVLAPFDDVIKRRVAGGHVMLIYQEHWVALKSLMSFCDYVATFNIDNELKE